MPLTDSVSVFAEGTFEEQIQELVNYLIRTQSDDDRAAAIRPFQDALATSEGQKPLAEDADRRRRVLDLVIEKVKDLGDGSDREIEGFFNLLFSHLWDLYPTDGAEGKQRLERLLQIIASAPSDHQSIKYRVLSNVFNAIPRTSSLRLAVYNTVLEVADSNGDLQTLQLSVEDVERWLSEWNISSEGKSAFLKAVASAHEKAGLTEPAYEYSRLYIRSLPPTSTEAKEAAVQHIAAALRSPTVFDFHTLFKLDAVVAVKDHQLFALLQVFLNGGLKELKAWESSHSSALSTYSLDIAQLERKIRLLTFSSLGFKNVGQDLPYSKIAEALEIDAKDVEKWSIDVIRAGLLWGKLSQINQSLHVTRSTARTFEKEQWEALEKRLVAWKAGLTSINEVIINAKKQAGLGQPPVVA